MVSNIFYFHPYLGKVPILTNIFQLGWFNHQLGMFSHPVNMSDPKLPLLQTLPGEIFPIGLGAQLRVIFSRRGVCNSHHVGVVAQNT